MKLKEFADNINKLLLEKPETADFDVVTSIDDEGNWFNLVYYDPQIGYYDKEDKEDKEFEAQKESNAVCIN